MQLKGKLFQVVEAEASGLAVLGQNEVCECVWRRGVIKILQG